MRIWRYPLLGSAGGPLRIGVPSELFGSSLSSFFFGDFETFAIVILKSLWIESSLCSGIAY